MDLFDSNAYFGHWPYWDLQDKTPDDLVALMDRAGIARAVVLSLRGMILDWRSGNDETLRECARRPDRLLPAVTLSPFMNGGPDELNRLADAGARCVRLYPQFHSYRLDATFVDDICRTAADRRLPVVIPTRPMMNWRFSAVSLETIGAVVERHPKTHFVMSGPNYLIEFQALARLMTRCANVSYEISCLQGFGAVKKLVGEVGVRRILFGTGATLNNPACNVAKLRHAGLTDEESQAVASGNATALFEPAA
jgi:uncharacterized protein